MSERSHLTFAAISRIENSKVKVTIRSLYLILDALEIPRQRFCEEFGVAYHPAPTNLKKGDIGAYLRTVREQQKKTLLSLESQTGISNASLSRLEREVGPVGHVFVKRIIELDRALELKGSLFAMYWAAASLASSPNTVT